MLGDKFIGDGQMFPPAFTNTGFSLSLLFSYTPITLCMYSIYQIHIYRRTQYINIHPLTGIFYWKMDKKRCPFIKFLFRQILYCYNFKGLTIEISFNCSNIKSYFVKVIDLHYYTVTIDTYQLLLHWIDQKKKKSKMETGNRLENIR